MKLLYEINSRVIISNLKINSQTLTEIYIHFINFKFYLLKFQFFFETPNINFKQITIESKHKRLSRFNEKFRYSIIKISMATRKRKLSNPHKNFYATQIKIKKWNRSGNDANKREKLAFALALATRPNRAENFCSSHTIRENVYIHARVHMYVGEK